MDIGTYIVGEDGKPEKCDDMVAWSEWLESANRRVDETFVGDVRISTVFLGVDYDFGGAGPPILYETMVFGGELDGTTERYSTGEAALAGHLVITKTVKRVEEKS